MVRFRTFNKYPFQGKSPLLLAFKGITITCPFHPIGRFGRHAKPSAFTFRRTNSSARSRGLRSAANVAIMSVSVTNDTRTSIILVVEDDIFMRFDIASCLQEAGYAVLEAASGENAIALCNSGIPIDIVFTDINLSGAASGWDVAECFRMQRSDVPVLYTSGEAIDPHRCVARSAFVAKPYQHVDILRACQRLNAS